MEAFCIASHHSGLGRDWEDYEISEEDEDSWNARNREGKITSLSSREEYESLERYVDENKLILYDMNLYPDLDGMPPTAKELRARMMLSCMVDADYTSTAEFCDPDSVELPILLNASELLERLDAYRRDHFKSARQDEGINRLRNIVYRDAADAGAGEPGFYRMTAPTGTAKTLALLKFGLEQASRNGQDRVIIVLPFLSIIEQNVAIYREICGEETVFEDDSQAQIDEKDKNSSVLKMYADKWNAPVIVTTSVKFFETLFENRCPQLRKLHSVANSVIVFDESQTLPLKYANATLETLKTLVDCFHCTVLFSSATQLRYQYRKGLEEIDNGIREVIKDPVGLYEEYHKLKNTDLTVCLDHDWTCEELAEQVMKSASSLAVLNTIRKAKKVYDLVFDRSEDKASCFLLTSEFAASHKLVIIMQINSRLKAGLPCRVISTQCIEAGVDLSFQTGFREIAPYTSIIQTSGRINRHCSGYGTLSVFRMVDHGEGDYPSPDYKNEASISKMLFNKKLRKGIQPNLDDLELMDCYSKRLFDNEGAEKDDSKLTDAVNDEDYEEIQKQYKLIQKEGSIRVIVPCVWETSDTDQFLSPLYEGFCEKCRSRGYYITKAEMKILQPLTVSTRLNSFLQKNLRELNRYTSYGPIPCGWYLLEQEKLYDFREGLIKEDRESAIFADI